MSNYIAYHFTIKPLKPATEILIAELGAAGFESFVESETGVTAYIQEGDFDETMLEDIFVLSSNEFEIIYTSEKIEQVNWNAEWERNFDPIVVNRKCTVRAPFHDIPNTEFDIIIEPKMSFGTGHHETTHMMLALMMEQSFENDHVLDMGCGTGVLAILASKMKAKSIDAIDIDEWCYENTVENIGRNNCPNIKAFLGDASLLDNQSYQRVIANINRNILLVDLPKYTQVLDKDGLLFLSGFYHDDIPEVRKKCESLGLEFVKNLEKNEWVACLFINKT
ncbi:50S ribosomal protein L11 methyltransferase [Spongiivirga citrea]|uniref:Ribosomal protein L11 methyltransferase n=1 Tax=Spongiivirga citrea TaxID=1481457 RepID=A0A6M0CJ74_9FLAO|nr:50S ribosomal protein L11 methyltransferase [Spongiivirga citrea]NER17881.1 50S ribosomal protein L11 methyltransferase [Spongiivirga citrea]